MLHICNIYNVGNFTIILSVYLGLVNMCIVKLRFVYVTIAPNVKCGRVVDCMCNI